MIVMPYADDFRVRPDREHTAVRCVWFMAMAREVVCYCNHRTADVFSPCRDKDLLLI